MDKRKIGVWIITIMVILGLLVSYGSMLYTP